MPIIHLEGGLELVVSNPTTAAGVRARVDAALAEDVNQLVTIADEHGETAAFNADRVVLVLPDPPKPARKRSTKPAGARALRAA